MDSFFVVCFCSLFSCIVGSKIFLVTIDIDMRSIFIFTIDIDLRSVFLYPPSISTLSHTKIPTLAARSSPLAFAFRHSFVLIPSLHAIESKQQITIEEGGGGDSPFECQVKKKTSFLLDAITLLFY